MELVQEPGREDAGITHVDLVLEEQRVGSGFRKHGPADPLVLHRPVFVRVADPELISFVEVMEDSS